MIVKTYKCGPATIHIRGDVDKEKLKKATIQFFTKSYRYKKVKGQASCQKTK